MTLIESDFNNPKCVYQHFINSPKYIREGGKNNVGLLPKQVLHLVWNYSDISTAINIVLKLACLGHFMEIIETIKKAEK